MKADVSGTRDGVSWPPRGEVINVPDDEGAQLCGSGMAEPVVEDRVETATTPEPEKRTPGRPRKQG
jgi:hypothetical protein